MSANECQANIPKVILVTPPTDGLDWLNWFEIWCRGWRWLLGALLVAGACSSLYARMLPDEYRSTATLASAKGLSPDQNRNMLIGNGLAIKTAAAFFAASGDELEVLPISERKGWLSSFWRGGQRIGVMVNRDGTGFSVFALCRDPETARQAAEKLVALGQERLGKAMLTDQTEDLDRLDADIAESRARAESLRANLNAHPKPEAGAAETANPGSAGRGDYPSWGYWLLASRTAEAEAELSGKLKRREMLQKRQEKEQGQSPLAVVAPPRAARTPVGPNRSAVVLGTEAVALALAAAGLLLAEALRRRQRSTQAKNADSN